MIRLKSNHKGAIRRENESRILKSAERVFSEEGFRGASIGMIAEAAGVPKPNVYYYFGSKEDLYSRIIQDICDSWLAAASLFDGETSPAAAFRGYVHAKMALSRERPEASRLWAVEIARGAPFLKSYLRDVVKPWVDKRVGQFEGWMAAGMIRRTSPKALIYMIWATTQAYADYEAQMTALNDGKKLTDQQFTEATEAVVDLVLHSIGLQQTPVA